jgi:transcriptional regulator with XRE-family HTH domain
MNDYRVGEKFKKLRKGKNLTLKSVAKETNISSAMLSLIENDCSIPSLKTVSRLASYYGVTISSLFNQNEINRSHKIYSKISYNIINRFVDSDIIIEELPTLISSKMKCTIMHVVKYCDVMTLLDKDNESFIYIINGKLKIIDDKNTYCLEEGDSIYIETFINMRIRPIECSSVKVLRVERRNVP